MSIASKTMSVGVSLVALLVLPSTAISQCSGNRGGGSANSTGSTGSLNPLIGSNSPSPFAYQQAMLQQQQIYALQQRLVQQQMQLEAMRRQLVQQNSEKMYETQRQMAAARKELKQQKQDEKAERIANLKAKRAAGQTNDGNAKMPALFTTAKADSSSQFELGN